MLSGLSWYWAPLCAGLGCTGGGLLLDVITGNESRTFQGEPYEELGFVGELIFRAGPVVASRFERQSWLVATSIVVTSVSVCFLRILVVARGLEELALWHRPSFKT